MTKKIMLVTGGSRGIGAQISLLAGKAGYLVAVNYASNQVEADKVVQSIKAAGGDAFAIQANCGKETDIVRMFKEIDKHGPIDTLVANAGIIGGQMPVEEIHEAQLKELFDINVVGVLLCTREAVKRMSTAHQGKGGNIILMSSAAARTGGILQEAHYAASKGAIDSFCLGISKEVGKQGIRVVAVRPGLIRTDIHDAHGGVKVIEEWASTIPMGRVGDPSEVAKTVIWLASPDASYIHGSFIDVAGGR
jgi:NAD(P)-dependent dehydrogenase (short-subunit alcohol dehydrogenase family)